MPVLADAIKFIDTVVLPRFREKEEEPITTGDLWRGNITISQAKKTFEKNGITRKLVTKIVNDTFDNWFTIKSKNEQLIKDVEELFSSKKAWEQEEEDGKVHLGLKQILRTCKQVGMVEGHALIALGFGDDADLDEPVENPKQLNYLAIFTPADISKIILDEDPKSKTYGEIIGAKVRMEKGEQKIIHASRFIYKPINVYGNNYKGMGYVRPAYNYLTVLDNVIWSTGQSFWRYASGFPHIKKRGGKSDQRKKIAEQWKNINSTTGWVSDFDTEIEFKGIRAVALNPELYFSVSLKAVSMCFDIPMQIVEGTAAGMVTGSETNLKDYYSDLSAKQELDWTPVVERLIRIAQITNQVAKGDFSIDWNPLQEMNAKERAEIKKLETETLKMQVEAGFRNAEDIKKEFEKTTVKVDVLEEFEYDRRTNFVASEVLEIEDNYYNGIAKLFSVSEIMKVIKNSNLEVVSDEFTDLEKELELIYKANEKKVKEIVDKNIDIAWLYSLEKSETFLGLNIISSEQAEKIKKILKQSNYAFVNGLGKDVTKKVLFTVQQSMLAGEGTSVLKKKIRKIVDIAKHNAETIARTETHRVMIQSLKQGYKDSGIVERIKVITAGDNSVRPHHADLEGQTFPLNQVPSELDEPNCRCTIVAVRGAS